MVREDFELDFFAVDGTFGVWIWNHGEMRGWKVGIVCFLENEVIVETFRICGHLRWVDGEIGNIARVLDA